MSRVYLPSLLCHMQVKLDQSKIYHAFAMLLHVQDIVLYMHRSGSHPYASAGQVG